MRQRRKRRSRSEIRAIRRRQRERQRAKRRLQLEALEPRILLTTLVGGDVFEYIGADGSTIRIAVTGDTIAELTASEIDDLNELLLGAMPGEFIDSDIGRTGTEVLGGRGGEDGVELIGSTPIIDPAGVSIFPGGQTGGAINIDAVASQSQDDGGFTWGINVGTVNVNDMNRTVIQLVQFDAPDTSDPADPFADPTISGDAEVQALMHQATLDEDRPATLNDPFDPFFFGLTNVQAYAVDPTSGLGYAVDAVGQQSLLYQVSQVDGTVSLIGEITNTDTGNPITNVQAAAFNSLGELFILTDNFDGAVGADATGDGSNTDVALVNVSVASATFTNADAQTVILGGNEATDAYTSLAFQTDGIAYAVARVQQVDMMGNPTGMATDELHRIFVGAGNTVAAQNVGNVAVGGGGMGMGGGGGTQVTGLAFAVDISDNLILVGVDQSQQEGARLVEININNGNAVALSQAGSVANVNGLSSFVENPGERPLLFSTDGFDVIRGSAVVLPIADDGNTQVATVSGATFRPTTGSVDDGLMFFVAQHGDGNADLDTLFNLDVDETNRSQLLRWIYREQVRRHREEQRRERRAAERERRSSRR